MGFVDTHYVGSGFHLGQQVRGVVGVGRPLTGGAVMRDYAVRTVAIVNYGLEQLGALPGYTGQTQAPQQFLRLAAEHGAANDFNVTLAPRHSRFLESSRTQFEHT